MNNKLKIKNNYKTIQINRDTEFLVAQVSARLARTVFVSGFFLQNYYYKKTT